MLNEFSVKTSQNRDFVDITDRVQAQIQASNIGDGICLVYSPHTTAAVTINENADPDVVSDLLRAYADVIGYERRFRHAEGNSGAHALTSLVGPSVTVPIHGQAAGNLVNNIVVGTETHLGRFTGSFNADGLLIITVANGDQLWVEATLTATSPTDFLVVGNYVGGTGRFAGATGAFSHGLNLVDQQGDFVYQIDAAITLQRPWNTNS